MKSTEVLLIRLHLLEKSLQIAVEEKDFNKVLNIYNEVHQIYQNNSDNERITSLCRRFLANNP